MQLCFKIIRIKSQKIKSQLDYYKHNRRGTEGMESFDGIDMYAPECDETILRIAQEKKRGNCCDRLNLTERENSELGCTWKE
jgi:hypothetical protein